MTFNLSNVFGAPRVYTALAFRDLTRCASGTCVTQNSERQTQTERDMMTFCGFAFASSMFCFTRTVCGLEKYEKKGE
jgi:hypothetical protein